MKNIKLWYQDMMWTNLPLLLLSIGVVLLLLLFRPEEARAANLREAGIYAFCLVILYDARGHKATARGIYSTFFGIPYRFTPWSQVTSVQTIQRREQRLRLSLTELPPDTPWLRRVVQPLSITLRYSTKNAAIIDFYYQNSLRNGGAEENEETR